MGGNFGASPVASTDASKESSGTKNGRKMEGRTGDETRGRSPGAGDGRVLWEGGATPVSG